jgi:putative transposase
MSRLRRLVLSDRFFFVTSRLMESTKVGSTLRINAKRKESGLFWQPRFFDRALRTVGEYCEKVEYLHLNPVRAGLVKRAEDWPWSSVHDHTGGAHHPPATPRGLAIDRVLLPADGRTRI